MDADAFFKALKEGKTLINNQGIKLYMHKNGVLWMEAHGVMGCAMSKPTIDKSPLSTHVCYKEFVIIPDYFEVAE